MDHLKKQQLNTPILKDLFCYTCYQLWSQLEKINEKYEKLFKNYNFFFLQINRDDVN